VERLGREILNGTHIERLTLWKEGNGTRLSAIVKKWHSDKLAELHGQESLHLRIVKTIVKMKKSTGVIDLRADQSNMGNVCLIPIIPALAAWLDLLILLKAA